MESVRISVNSSTTSYRGCKQETRRILDLDIELIRITQMGLFSKNRFSSTREPIPQMIVATLLRSCMVVGHASVSLISTPLLVDFCLKFVFG